MRINIKTVRHLEIPAQIKRYAENKIRKFEKRLPNPSLVEIIFEDTLGPKEGKDKKVHLKARLLKSKEYTFHLKETASNFREAVDLLQEKFERKIEEYKE
jgi:ribosomal subunit interface protein|uniref:Ribosome-associated translation inhibitor RaiA n=1 Tax=candidate division CPR3 bacterium TaxID=2268181 RepID=A0A7V3JB04_UNCC3